MRNKLLIILLLLAAFAWNLSFGQKAVYHQIQDQIQQGRSFREVKVFNFSTADVHNRDLKIGGLAKGVVLNLDQDAILQLRNEDNDFIQFQLPVSDRQDMKINLMRHQIFTQDFTVQLSDGSALNYTGGLYYKGVVEGMPNSVVAISIFDNEVMGMISTDDGNLVLGPIDNNHEMQHILYNDLDLDKKFEFLCGTSDEGPAYTADELASHAQTRDNGDCVRLYIEIDDDIVTQKGGATPATNYITGLFNQSIVLYTNESVNVMLNQIYAWVTVSPYTGSTSSAMLTSFQNLTGEFNGNVAMLVSYQTSGGIAMLDGLCQSNPDWRKSFSAITSSYSNVPTYSWSVMVVTHEAGHVIGSKHTHACAWNGNNTAIDGCAGASEGSCPLGPIPSGGGTIMSYCHLIQNVGINFTLGFGPQPGNVIRGRVNAANNCLTSCGPPPPPPPQSYCSSAGTNSSYEWINKVVLGSINNTSGNNGGYHDYTSLSTNLTAGSTYSINLTPGYASGTYLEYWRVWIDYNNDLDWADAGEQVGQGSGTTAINVSFTVPSNTPAGTKRMRVAMKYSGYPALCEIFTYGEVEDYNVAITTGGSGASCSDGIQNQGETGIDCGGPCPACPTCSDGIQNQGETGIDCGGPCQPCPPPGGGIVLLASYFETGWDSWLDGGADVTRVSSTYSYEGSYSIRLADNSGTQSAMTSPTFNMSGGTGATIKFYFKSYSMEAGEDFWVRYNNGGGWVTIGVFTAGSNFSNGIFYVTTVTVPNFAPTNGTFRIQCDASDNNDQVYIDQVTITKLTGSALPSATVEVQEVGKDDDGSSVLPEENEDLASSLSVFPNPANDVLNIAFHGEISDLHIISLQGQDIRVRSITNDHKQVDINSLVPGIYFLNIQSGGQWYPIRFSKM